MTQVIERPEIDNAPLETKEPFWLVTVYNNETNTYEEVVSILVLATGCTPDEAYIEAWEIDHYGQSVVHRASEDQCKTIAEIVATIGIKVEAAPEP
jgi:ATP-dependent Clp protease adaptor protein ClpS